MKQRMRRISALLLVALMCVSCVVPAFAAESEGCPAVHTKSNCEYTQIGEPHEAACGVQGYTTYQCNACKAYFADDFVNAAGSHAWQIVDQAPTCTEDGVFKKLCLNCGEEKDLITLQNKEYYEATGHDWEFKNGENCAEGMICEECGETSNEVGDKGHTWGKPVLTVKPTHTTSKPVDGTAKFTCEVCGETKTVNVIHDGAHSWKIDLTKYPSCEEAGYYGGATCVICGKVAHIVPATGCGATACTVEGCDHTVDEKNCGYATCTVADCTHYVLATDADGKALEHCTTANCSHENCADPVCHKASDACAEDCVHSYAPYQEMAIINCKPSVEWVVTLPTCTAAGSAYKACTMCKKAVGTPTTLDPLGHNYQTKIYKEVTTGGLTAEQIAMFEALAENVAAGTSYTYTFYVEAEDGTLTTVTGSATVERYVLANAQNLSLTEAPATTGGSSSTTTPAPKTYVWTGEYKNVDPTDVDEAGNTYMHWGNNCSTETTSYRYACTVCGAEETPVSFIGHYWVQTDYQAPVCSTTALTAGYTEYTCANPNCDGLLEDRDENDTEAGISYSVIADDLTTEKNELRAVKRVSVAAGHVFTTVTVPVTCISVGYKYDVCTCGQIDYSKAAEGYGEEDTPANAIKGAYDIVAIDPSAHDVKEEVIVPVTCTTNGTVHKYCGRAGCEYNAPVSGKYLESFVTVTATGHKKGDTYVDDTTDATCLKAKYRHYHCANLCGQFIDEVISPKKDHSYVLESVTPDCTSQQGNNVLRCQNGCNQISTETVPATKFDKTNPDHHTGEEILSVVKGDCTTLDKVMYYCPNCNTTWIREEDFVGSFDGTIYVAGEGVGHDWKKKDAVKPTCADDGKKEHYECSVCHKFAADENGETLWTADDVKIPKLSETGDHPKLADGTWDLTKVYYTEAVDATCTTAGHTAGLFCNECDSWISEEGTITKYEHKYNSTYHEGKVNGASAFEDVEGEYASGVASCTTWGYQLQECALCGEQQIVGYDPMWTEDGEHKLAANNDAEVPTCCTVGYTASQSCTVCGQLIVEREVIAKVPHVNKDGEEFYGICTDTVEDRECVVCKKGEFEYKYTDANGDEQTATIVITCDGNHDDDADTVNVPNFVVTYPEADAEKLAQGAHSWIVTDVEPTCMSYSYTLIVCEHCGYSFMTDEGATFSDEHAWGEWEITEASYTAEGKKVRECLLCDATEEVVIPKLVGIYAEIELDNAVAEGEILPDNGTVSLTVTTNASDLKVWGVRIELTYTGKIEQDADGKDVITVVSLSDKFGAEGLQVYHDPANKKITIVGTAPNGADGKLGEVTFDGEEELVQINLKLGKNSDGISVYTEKFEVNDKAQNYIEPIYDWSEEIYVGVMTGDVDGDYDVDINDAKALKKIITGESEEEYSSAADMNQDGEVTATDFAVMTNKLLGKKA